MAMINKFKQ